nr:hypothetical protein [Tanacetum cinerariifolium]
MNTKLNEEFLTELHSNVYCGTYDEDVVDHIAKVLEILNLIKTPNVDTYRLRMKVFPLSLADDVRQWWIYEGDGKITTWEELVEKFFCKLYPLSRDGKYEMVSNDDNSELQAVAATDDSPAIPEQATVETPLNMSPAYKAHFESEKEAIHLILTGIGDEIYSNVSYRKVTTRPLMTVPLTMTNLNVSK